MSSVAAVQSANLHFFRVSPLFVKAPPESISSGYKLLVESSFSACGEEVRADKSAGVVQSKLVFASVHVCKSLQESSFGGLSGRGRFQLATFWKFVMDQATGARGSGEGGAQGGLLGVDQVDRLVKQRLEQAFGGVFGRLLETTERAAQAAEAQASWSRSDNLVKSLKIESWKPGNREEELRTWREWSFQLTNWLIANDSAYEQDLKDIDIDFEVDHSLMDSMLCGVLCSLLKGRLLLLIRGLESTKCGFEAFRILKREMEPKEKARSLALMRQLAAWQFSGSGGLREQLVKYEEALKTYESSAGKPFLEELVLATVVTGLKEPLKSQVQLRMTSGTKYSEVREWILQYESLNAPWSTSLVRKGNGGGGDGPQPMEVDLVKGKSWGKGVKGKYKDGKGKQFDKGKGKDGKGKGKSIWTWME